MSEKLFEKTSSMVSKHAKEKLVEYSMELKIPISRLISLAIDNELMKENPFSFLREIKIPKDEYVEYAYADQAGKILNYMREAQGLGLDQLILLRHDIGVPDREEFLHAFRECIEKGFLTSYKPKPSLYQKTDYAEGYVYYCLKGASKPERKKTRNKASRYEQFQKLKKEFKHED